jgi:adenosylcobinamide hydrolase
MTFPAADLMTHHRIVRETLVIDLGTRMRVLSSAPQGGGLRMSRYILNHQVLPRPVKETKTSRASGSPPRWEDPARYLRRIALGLGADGDCVGLMTAVPMTQLVTGRESEGGIWVECYATVGVTNAVRAGEPPRQATDQGADGTAGTINLILITNACLSASALVGAVQVATESKTGLLRDHAVPSWTGCPGATGTGTDAVVVACAVRGGGPWTSYAGTHTAIGSMIGRVTAGCLSQGLARATRWSGHPPQ